MSLLSLLVCFSCLRILILLYSSMLLPLCPCPYPNNYLSPKAFISLYQYFPPLSSISIKGMPLLIQRVALGVDGWHLNLAFFMDTTTYIGITLLWPLRSLMKDLWPWYQLVGHLPLCHSMGHPLDKLELLFVRELALLDDHLKLRITCGTTIWCARYHLYEYHL